MNARWTWTLALLLAGGCLAALGCHGPGECGHTPGAPLGPPHDRPFPLGQVSDAHWETQQTNAEASDFVFYHHEFVGQTAKLTPAGKKHLLQVALRLPHVPFPVVIEESENKQDPQLDETRRQAIVGYLTRLGVEMIDSRVVVAPAISEGLSAVEGEGAYYSTLQGDFGYGGGTGRRFGGRGGSFR